MNILVCIKRVPATAGQITLTPDGQDIDTRYLGFTISPHQECAVEKTVRMIKAHGAALGLDHYDGFLDGAFLVGTDREAEVARVDVLAVGRQRDLAGRGRDTLDADEDVHGRPVSAPHAGVLRVEERRWADDGDRGRVLLAEIFDRQFGAGLRLLRR